MFNKEVIHHHYKYWNNPKALDCAFHHLEEGNTQSSDCCADSLINSHKKPGTDAACYSHLCSGAKKSLFNTTYVNARCPLTEW